MDPQNSSPDCILCHDLKMLQHAVVCHDLLPGLLLGFSRDKVSLVATIFFSSEYSFYKLCRDRSFFGYLTICLARSVVLSALCHYNLKYGYWNICFNIDNCVTTVFMCSFFKLVSRPNFYVATTCLFGSCCNNVSCVVRIFVATRKVCRDKVLSPLNLISCCSFILILRHSFLVLMFSVATQFLCRDRTFLYLAYICVTTQFVMSRQDLSPLCWNLCCNIEKSIATLFIDVQLISVS